MIVDKFGYRMNVGIILVNESNRVFWGKRIGHDAWQFPQGGLFEDETPLEAMYRELFEEVGLEKNDVELLGYTRHWLKYRLPKQYVRHTQTPLVIGQKQRWYLLRLTAFEQKIRLDMSESPEFDSWRWLDYDEPPNQVIFFKKQVYSQALKELLSCLKRKKVSHGMYRKKHKPSTS